MAINSTSAQTTFFGGGLELTKQDTYLNVTTPEFLPYELKTETKTETKTKVDSKILSNSTQTLSCNSNIETQEQIYLILNKDNLAKLEHSVHALGDIVAFYKRLIGNKPVSKIEDVIPSDYLVSPTETMIGKVDGTQSFRSLFWKCFTGDSSLNSRPIIIASRMLVFTVYNKKFGDAFKNQYDPNTFGRFYSCLEHWIEFYNQYGVNHYIGGNNLKSCWTTDITNVARGVRYDPVAQSFKVDFPCFLSGIGLFFHKLDSNANNLFCEIRVMENGFPSSKIIYRKNINKSIIKTSNDGSVETFIEFDYPVYVSPENMYCFIVGGDSPNTEIWVAQLNRKLINSNNDALYNDSASIGIMFESQNGSSWSAVQNKDIKYNLYCANFNSNNLNITFQAYAEKELLPQNPFESEKGNKQIRIYIPDHGLNAGDSITLSCEENIEIKIRMLDSTIPKIGQTIASSTGTSIISNIRPIYLSDGSRTNEYIVTFSNNKGWIQAGQLATIYEFDIFAPNGTKIESVKRSSCVIENAPYGIYNGVNLSELNQTLTIDAVNDADSVLVTINSTPTDTGRFGGTSVYATPNIKYEMFNISGDYQKYTCSENWIMNGIYHNLDDGHFITLNNTQTPEKQINIKTDQYLGIPQKLLNPETTSKLNLYTTIQANFNSNSNFISPMLNADTFNMTIISNRIDSNNPANQSQGPNGLNRFHYETETIIGSALYKYVTQEIVLAKPASDLQIYLDVYKDIYADFDIYVKLKKPFDGNNIDSYNWIKLEIPNKINNLNLEFTEYSINMKDTTYDFPDLFQTFKVKIVGTSTNPAKPTLFKNLRVIALT